MTTDTQYISPDMLAKATMTPIEEAQVRAGKCPRCMRSTLKHFHDCAGMSFHQCLQCLHVFVLNSSPD